MMAFVIPPPSPGDAAYLSRGPKHLRFLPGVIVSDSCDGAVLHIFIKDVGDFEFPAEYFKRHLLAHEREALAAGFDLFAS